MAKNKKINFCLAKECFITCAGCYNEFTNETPLETNEMLEFLEYSRQNGVKRITISGGDPLTMKDIEKIIKHADYLKLNVNLDTVGTAFLCKCQTVNKNQIELKNLEDFKTIKMIGIPLDGSNNAIVNKFRVGRPDLFDEQIKIIKRLVENNLNVCVNTVVHKENYEDILNIFEKIKDVGIKKLQLSQFMPIGPRGSKNKDLFYINDSQFKKVVSTINGIKNKCDFEIVAKSLKSRVKNYMLISSSGAAYKVDKRNRKVIYGEIKNKDTWYNIMQNL